MACDGHQLILFTAMHKNAHAPSYPGQDIVVCNFFAHTKNQPHFCWGTELEQHCMTPNTAFPITSTHVSSVLKSINFLWLHRQMGTHYRRAPSSHCALLCLSPHCPLTVFSVCSIGTCLPGAGCVETDLCWCRQCQLAASRQQQPSSSTTGPHHTITPPPSPTFTIQPQPATLVKVSDSNTPYWFIDNFRFPPS